MSKSKFSRYRNLLIIYALYIIFWFILASILRSTIFPDDTPAALIRFIPVDDMLVELILVFVLLLPVSGLIGMFLGGYILSPIIMFLHKFFYKSNKFYGIQYESEPKKVSLLSSGFYPVLMAVNLSFIFLTPEIISAILTADVISDFTIALKIPVFIRLLGQIILLIFTFGASTLLFSPVWLLKDSGIVFTTKNKVENSNEMILIKSIGEWFQTLLKGYAGIGVMLTYIFVIYDFVTLFINNLGLPGNMLNIPSLILWLGLPFYLVLSIIPAVIFHDILKNRRINYVRKIANRFGIRDAAIVSFKLRERETND
ncbi:MAG: hypothetical protein KGD74_01740 [Candidatus Lokiarchaeota archaeon]|nr:hypothetical protein [Candidatus Lokiarchaeota archaeon]